MDSDDLEIKELIKDICKRFPEVSNAINERMIFMGYTFDDPVIYDNMETFSQCTSNITNKRG